MNNTTKLAALMLMATAGIANAGGSEGSIGVGAEYMLSSFSVGGSTATGPGTTFGLGGPSLNYDAGKFHVGGFLSVLDPGGTNNTTVEVGGRFYYHAHSTAMTDFGIGGSIGIINYDAGRDRNTAMFIEPGFQIRVFLQSNVALSFTAGLAIGAADADGVYLIGDPVGGAGLHYYFF